MTSLLTRARHHLDNFAPGDDKAAGLALIRDLADEVERLRKALRVYGMRHKRGCGFPCDCGLDAALEER